MHTGCQLMAKICYPCDNHRSAATGVPNGLDQSTLRRLYDLKGELNFLAAATTTSVL